MDELKDKGNRSQLAKLHKEEKEEIKKSYLEEAQVKGRDNLVQAMDLHHLPVPQEDDGFQ